MMLISLVFQLVITSIQQAIEMVDTFLNTHLKAGRHGNRVKKIACK